MESSTTARVSSPVVRWFAIGMITALAAAGAWQFGSIGTRQADLWALGLAAIPIAVWWEAAHIRAAAGHELANRILMSWAGMQMVLWLLAMYAADLAECD
jgi:hypothetical protein